MVVLLTGIIGRIILPKYDKEKEEGRKETHPVEESEKFVGPRAYLFGNTRGHFLQRFTLVCLEVKRMRELDFNVEHRLHVHREFPDFYKSRCRIHRVEFRKCRLTVSYSANHGVRDV